jgi:hypothetical protein
MSSGPMADPGLGGDRDVATASQTKSKVAFRSEL